MTLINPARKKQPHSIRTTMVGLDALPVNTLGNHFYPNKQNVPVLTGVSNNHINNQQRRSERGIIFTTGTSVNSI